METSYHYRYLNFLETTRNDNDPFHKISRPVQPIIDDKISQTTIFFPIGKALSIQIWSHGTTKVTSLFSEQILSQIASQTEEKFSLTNYILIAHHKVNVICSNLNMLII